MHWLGQGTPRNEAEAVTWWMKAAQQDNAAAQFDLGSAYRNGKGVAADLSQARYWWSKAAALGLVEAQNKLRILKNDNPAVVGVHAPAPAAAAEEEAEAAAPDISRLLVNLNMSEYIDTFAKEKIDIEAAKLLSEDELKELGLPMGPRKKLQRALKDLQESQEKAVDAAQKPRAPGSVGRQMGECVICLEWREMNCVFSPCGHVCACIQCANSQLKTARTCPMCRQRIDKVLQTYHSFLSA